MTSTASRTSARTDVAIRLAVTALVLGLLGVVLFVLPRYRWAWHLVWTGDRPALFLAATWTTLWISLLGLLLSLALGLGGGLARLSRRPVPNQLGAIYVELVRGTPLLVQVLLAYYCVAPILGNILTGAGAPAFLVAWTNEPYLIGVVTLGIFGGAYVTEIVRAAVQSIDPGQTEAALSQGMTRWQVYRHVIFPQAVKRMIPPLTGQFVNLIKDSSLLMLMPGVYELAKRASVTRSSTYKDYEVLIPLALLYFALCYPLSRLARRLELRLQV
jgi:polar amino acid transport system permease protein